MEYAFSALVDKTGPAGAAALRQMATDFFNERRAGIAIGSHPRPSLDNHRSRASLDVVRHPNLSRIESSVQFQV